MDCLDDEKVCRALVDAYPDPILIVNELGEIQGMNQAAGKILGTDARLMYQKRGGEAIHCIHSFETPEGCGYSPSCRDCSLRNSIKESMTGRNTVRRKTTFEMQKEGGVQRLPVLITATHFSLHDQSLVILVLEDLSAMEQLGQLVPICALCKKIRDDHQYWNKLEDYLHEHHDFEFTHGLCPTCVAKMEKEIAALR